MKYGAYIGAAISAILLAAVSYKLGTINQEEISSLKTTNVVQSEVNACNDYWRKQIANMPVQQVPVYTQPPVSIMMDPAPLFFGR